MKTAKRQAKWSLSILLLILMLSLAYTSYGADTLKPHPISPQTWRFFPAPSGSTSITMQASRCYDSNEPCSPPVWYYYQCTTTGHTDINSGWIQDSNATYDANTIWTATGLDPNTTYGFKYRARDSADPCNMTNWSGAKSAKTDKATTPAVLRLDLNAETDSNAINNRPGFTPFTIADSGKTIGGVSVDLAANISEKRNPDPCGQWFSMLGDANQEYYQRAGETLYQDMIFGISPNGIKVTLWGLGVNQDCNLTLFAYDDKSTSEGNRVAHWFSNGTPIFDTNFIGGLSTSLRNENDYPNDIYKWAYSKRVTADAFGRIVLTSTKGSGSPETQPFSFINALVVEPNALTPFVPTKYAYHPVPVDDTNNVPADVTLEWKQGGYAEKHDVYLGTNLAKVTDANRSNPLGVLVSENQSTTTYTPPEFLDFSTTYYWRIDEVNSAPDYTIFKGEVWSFTTSVLVLIASNPVPLDDAEGVLADVTLSWEKGDYAEKHDVYLGTDLAKVTDANRSNSLGVLVSENQSATTYDPPESLDSDTTYYWRIDEVNSAPDYTIFKGDIWSFETYHAPHSRYILPPYELGMWQGFKSAAVSYTFDDGFMPNLYSIAIPMFNEPNFGFKLTAYPVINWLSSSNWTALQNATAVGHEVGCHTVTHNDLSGMSRSQVTWELSTSKSLIEANMPGQCDTLAYPNCNSTYDDIVAQYFIAARTCSGAIEPNTPANFYRISSFICGNSGLNSPAAFYSTFANTVASQGWCVFCIHALDDDSGYSPLSSAILRSSLEYLAANRSTFWVQTFGNVVRYIKERNDVDVAESSNLGYRITLQVTDTLDDANYNYPITLRRPLPEGWPSATVSQNGLPVDVCSVMVGSTKYIMFDVVPDGGDVVLSRSLHGGIVDMNYLSAFCSYWLLDDCDETEGVDLNDDCLVNFYEYAFLANNWLMQAP